MEHEFFILENEEILNESKWFLRKNISKKNILLNDDVIEGNSLFFKGFKSFKVSLKNPGEGLDYGGITLIPYTSMNNFINNLRKVEVSDYVNEYQRRQIKDLIMLSEEAAEKKLYIIHFGL